MSITRRSTFVGDRERQVRVSGRFAPELYVAVVPITGSVDVQRLGGEGEPIECAVKLVKFDEGDRLDSRFVTGRLTAAECRALGEAIAAVEECLPAARRGDPRAPPTQCSRPRLSTSRSGSPP